MESSFSDFIYRRGLAWSAFTTLDKIWKAFDDELPLPLKIRIWKASVQSVLLYGCKSWIIDQKLESQINSFGISCYRTLLGISRLDRIPNLDILKRVKQEPLIQTVRARQLGWLGHTLRRDNEEPAKVFALYEPPPGLGKCKAGRPKLTYREHISAILTSQPDALSLENIVRLANDRKEWKKRVEACRSVQKKRAKH